MGKASRRKRERRIAEGRENVDVYWGGENIVATYRTSKETEMDMAALSMAMMGEIDRGLNNGKSDME